MDDLTIEDYKRCYAELAQFCFRKVASLEARFVVLCHRAEALGIDTQDIIGVEVTHAEGSLPVRVVN